MADVIKVPVSFGEVLDKITILEIKSERIKDDAKLKNVKQELNELNATWTDAVSDQSAIAQLRQQLKAQKLLSVARNRTAACCFND